MSPGKLKKADLAHLRAATRAWVEGVRKAFILEPHHERLLLAAAEQWDRTRQAVEVLAEDGLVIHDRAGVPKGHPMLRCERESKILFEKLVRSLGLDLIGDEDPHRPPTVQSRRGR